MLGELESDVAERKESFGATGYRRPGRPRGRARVAPVRNSPDATPTTSQNMPQPSQHGSRTAKRGEMTQDKPSRTCEGMARRDTSLHQRAIPHPWRDRSSKQGDNSKRERDKRARRRSNLRDARDRTRRQRGKSGARHDDPSNIHDIFGRWRNMAKGENGKQRSFCRSRPLLRDNENALCDSGRLLRDLRDPERRADAGAPALIRPWVPEVECPMSSRAEVVTCA